MNGNSHRIAYEALKAGLEAAEAEGDSAALDRAIAALDGFIATMVTDPRRLRAIALDSPGAAAEIQARAAELSLPRQVLDPSFDPSFARLWVASLDDSAIAMVHRVMAEELRRRDGDNIAPRRMAAMVGRG
ncbi:MAG: hypothetical protein ING03_08230 [Roseomonas sp.]|nr:hypothetical protein [Roseomonas sp.]MCA3309412.1 hypothetical protein [Roseomonas sp.]MCA3316907.1 hypothetical protein [Roseomonas sp.]MCA3320849.1 hypothetical protein [Roseomonas sp.]